MKKLGFVFAFVVVNSLSATNQSSNNSESMFPLNNSSGGGQCEMKSPTAPGNRLVANRNGPVSKSMPGQCMGHTLMHQMLLAGASFGDGPQMSEQEVMQKLEGLKSGKPQTFTGVKNISELSKKYSGTLKQFADKMQMGSFYSLQRLGMGAKLLTGMSKSTGSGSDLERMYQLTQQGKKPAMVLGHQGSASAHVVLVDKIEKKGSMYSITYADSNVPDQASHMQCSADGNCETQMGNQKAYALKGSEESRAFSMAGKSCQASGSNANNTASNSATPEAQSRTGSHI